MRQLLRRAWYAIRQRRHEADLAEEMDFHRAMKQRELEDGGLASSSADRAARRELGNITLAREDARAVWLWPWLESVWQDSAYAIRSLLRQPGFTAVVVCVLGGVLGLNATLVTVAAGAILRPWPGIQDPATVARVYVADQYGQAEGMSFTNYRDLAAKTQSLAGFAAMNGLEIRLDAARGGGTAGALSVTGNFFDVLGVSVVRGRAFLPAEDRLGAPEPVTILTHTFWQSRFGGDPAIIGTTVRLNDVPFTVVGIASREFGGSEAAYDKALFVPIAARSLLFPNDHSLSSFFYQPEHCCVDVVGRLAPGVTREQARAELEWLGRTFITLSGAKARGMAVTGTEFASEPGRGNSSSAIAGVTLLFTALVLVWLLACANVGNLLLSRAAARVREIGIRLSLGASRRRLVRQLLTEGFVLALAASALGVGIAYQLPLVIMRIVGGAAATSFPFPVAPDAVVLVASVLFAAVSALAFALAPALHATRTDVSAVLNQRAGLPASRFPLRGLLLSVQVAVSVILLVSAGLLVRGIQRQGGSFDPGLAVDEVTVVSFDLPASVYDPPRTAVFFSELADAMRTLSSGDFGLASRDPFNNWGNFGTFLHLPGESAEKARLIQFQEVSPGYMGVLQIPILAGRDLQPTDGGRPVVLINEAMARRYWPGENPIGQTFYVRQPTGSAVASREIVGVVRNVRTTISEQSGERGATFYAPFQGRAGGKVQAPLLLVRTDAVRPDAIAQSIARIDPRVRIRTAPLSASLEAVLDAARWGPMLAGVLGAFALVLATVGMFGVFAYAVRQRTREIGIRMALGAERSAVVRLVLLGHSRAVLIGLGAGLLGALAASQILRSRLHGLSPFDPLAYAGVAVLLACAGLLATYVPTRRATRIDPVVALRTE